MYRIFNVAIDSELALPELARLNDPAGLPVYQFREADDESASHRIEHVHWFHDWCDPNGAITISAGRGGGKSWLRFPRLADFEIDLAAKQIAVYSARSVEASTLRHLLLDQVIPRVLGQAGQLVLHAGAVRLEGGQVVGFIGDTGYGKSTLVSSFEQNGARLITDDCALVALVHGRPRLIPNYAGLRLYDDSIRAIYGSSREVAEMAHYTSKRRLVMPTDAAGAEDHPLNALFLLGNPLVADPEHVEIGSSTGTDALMALLAQCFVLDSTDKANMAGLFQAAGDLLGANVRCSSLNYPRRHDQLSAVRAAVSGFVG